MFGLFGAGAREKLVAERGISLDAQAQTITLPGLGTFATSMIERVRWSKRTRGDTSLFSNDGRASVRIEFRAPEDRMYVAQFTGRGAETKAEAFHSALCKAIREADPKASFR